MFNMMLTLTTYLTLTTGLLVTVILGCRKFDSVRACINR